MIKEGSFISNFERFLISNYRKIDERLTSEVAQDFRILVSNGPMGKKIRKNLEINKKNAIF